MEWEVLLSDGQTPHVHADGWQINDNGDLAFVNVDRQDTVYVRAYASGAWKEVILYA